MEESTRKGVVVQVKGLGVPVQAHSTRVVSGFELRWSSDPDVGDNSPAHVLFDHKGLTNFLQFAVDPSFQEGDLISFTPVDLPEGINYLSKADCLAYGISAEHWQIVRCHLTITGSTGRGPVTDKLDWVGTRQEYFENAHITDAHEHAKSRDMTRVTVFTTQDGGHLLRAAEGLKNHQRQMRPSLRAAELVMDQLQKRVMDSDLHNITSEHAIHFLRQLQHAFVAVDAERVAELADFGLEKVQMLPMAETAPEPAPAKSPSSPRLH